MIIAFQRVKIARHQAGGVGAVRSLDSHAQPPAEPKPSGAVWWRFLGGARASETSTSPLLAILIVIISSVLA